jgi:transcriptional regulator with XRE-family HTH domain
MGTSRAPNKYDKAIGKKLKEARVASQLSQADVANAMGGLTFQQVQKYEGGTNRISAGHLWMAAKYLGKPIAWFFPEE